MNLAPPNEETRQGAFALRSRLFHTAGLRGFSFVELLVAVSIGAAVLGTAVICFQAAGASGRRLSTYGAVEIGAAVMTNFYGTNTNSVRTWFAPNYGRIASAEVMREKFLEDIQRAVAVYCLPRVGRSSIRPTSIALSGSYDVSTFDVRRLDTPEAFRQFLASAIPASASTFATNAFASEGAARGQNLSILVLIPSDSPAALNVHAVYEVDFVRATDPGGTYASVRRYQGSTTTDYYDVFYQDKVDGFVVNSDDFYVAASFERAGRPTITTISENKVAATQPFYFVWWPDPSSQVLPVGTEYRDAMADQTSFFMTVPMFPAL